MNWEDVLNLQILELQGFAISNKLRKLASSISYINFCHDFAISMGVLYKEVDNCAKRDGRCVAACQPSRG